MKTLGIGILGHGFMGKTHSFAHRTIPFYYDPPPVRTALKVICGRNPERARAAAEALGFERSTTNMLDVVNAPDVDIVHVCTPNDAHLPALKAAIRAGKHIYCEKPVTAKLSEAEELEKLLPAYRGLAQTVLQNRFFPSTLRAKQLVQEGFLGPVTQFRAAFLHSGNVDPNRAFSWKFSAAAGGGVIRDLGPHVIDLLDHLVGPFAAVHTLSRIWAGQRPDPAAPGQSIAVDTEDAAVMLVRSGDGAIGTLEVSKIATGVEDDLRFEIHGRYGAMRYTICEHNYLEIYDGRLPGGDFGGARGWQRLATIHRYPSPGGKFPSGINNVGWLRGHVHSLYSFLKCVAEGTPPAPSLADGLYLQRVLEAACESAAADRWVELPRKNGSAR
ncbi:MAG: Gfo/Idh/MocA family oxidoreductase [Planctomycetota bacterium]